MHGDDEDVCIFIDAETAGEAAYQFHEMMCEANGVTDADLATNEDRTQVYVTNILRSDSPMSFALDYYV